MPTQDYENLQPDPRSLFLETKLFDKCVVAALVGCFEVLQVATTIRNEAKETTARVLVLRIFLEVCRKFIDTASQKRDLDLGRPGVSVVATYLLHFVCLFLLCQHGQHNSTS